VRALKLDARFYNKLVDHFHSPAVQLDRLAALWTQTVLRLFPQPLRINGRCVVVGDGIKVPKRGRNTNPPKESPIRGSRSLRSGVNLTRTSSMPWNRRGQSLRMSSRPARRTCCRAGTPRHSPLG
jgi:hypothetical protein